ncbi:Na(+)-translocating NADH-quinone reductase subunit C [Kineobactrum sediminis]|uniref:Na(+)-translocating NADH-quinone reductase subunit C n=1 Tax=Kineobactrum sediminis TaxID=1905677 RepID=A0A2N5Y1E4_9GAMM|nr:Na(+)-translocating NADH-quinone reductase subunit C [Kineobactrum sediminis]PLW82204.1 Na(+)-translocating NADH-quinone reductase subunit C [Kineobactrum sediminis]
MSSNDSIRKTLLVALSLCIVCSVIVSTAAVMLKPVQEVNKTLDRKRNILAAAGMLEQDRSVEEQFAQVKTRVVDLRTGEFTDDVDPATYEPLKAAKNPARSTDLEEDPANIGRREDYSLVYLVENESGELDKLILPVRGYGLWSTLYGFIALESDANTVAGLGFYEHGETPGLGGEVDNPRWKAQWPGKKVYRDGEVELKVVKGSVDASSDLAPWRVDGLSGATLTSRGVSQLVQFWLGERGYKPFLNNLKSGEA